MDEDQIRAAFISALKELANGPFGHQYQSYGKLFAAFFYAARELRFLENDPIMKHDPSGPPSAFKEEYQPIVSTLFWEHVIGGMVSVGNDPDRFDVNYFKITEFGRSAFDEEVNIYDPSGTIDWLKRQTNGEFDEIVEQYYAEAMACYRRGCFRASLILTGVATEGMFLNLAGAFVRFLNDQQGADLKKTLKAGWRFKGVYDEFKKCFDPICPKIEKQLNLPGLQEQLGAVRSFIMKDRNEQGHPIGVAPDKNVALSNLSWFRRIYISCYKLTKYFENEDANKAGDNSA